MGRLGEAWCHLNAAWYVMYELPIMHQIIAHALQLLMGRGGWAAGDILFLPQGYLNLANKHMILKL